MEQKETRAMLVGNILSGVFATQPNIHQTRPEVIDAIVKAAVEIADKALKELEK